MKLSSLQNRPGSRRARMRVGRGMGSGKGKTSGRGHKGQYARSGHKHKPGFEGGQMRMIRRLPKRGFRSMNPETSVVVNIGDLNRFPDGAVVSQKELHEAGLIRGVEKKVKILGTGELTRKLTVKADAFSASARTKIESAGGSCEVTGTGR